MDNIKKLFNKDEMGQLILCILFIIYLIMGYKTPQAVANIINLTVSKIIIFIVVVLLFINANPILAVLSLFVAYVLITNSSLVSGNDALVRFLPSEEKKNCEMSAYNFTPYHQFPYTLEQEVVKKMAPLNEGCSATNANFKPLLENDHDAANVNFMNK